MKYVERYTAHHTKQREKYLAGVTTETHGRSPLGATDNARLLLGYRFLYRTFLRHKREALQHGTAIITTALARYSRPSNSGKSLSDDTTRHSFDVLLQQPCDACNSIVHGSNAMPLMRIPYTAPLPSPTIIPASASNLSGAIEALQNFLQPRRNSNVNPDGKTLILSGAGISVASGLADYRGTNGTYTLNKTYRPIYFHEFSASHEARKRYWARSYLGWTTLHRSIPNPAHHAVRHLGEQGHISRVITQNVDSFHPKAHPFLPTLELHGYLRSTVCLTCRSEYSRDEFQEDLSRMNPAWSAFLAEMLESGALSTEDPAERRKLGLKTNPDGDVDVPGVEYGTFRYPPCPRCLDHKDVKEKIRVDEDGAWASGSTAGILKPAVIMFGESIPNQVKVDVETAVDEASRLLILGSSLATYSAWRLVKRAKEQGKAVAAINQGGVRGEENFFADVPMGTDGSEGVRCALPLESTLPALAEALRNPQVSRRSERPFQPAPWARM